LDFGGGATGSNVISLGLLGRAAGTDAAVSDLIDGLAGTGTSLSALLKGAADIGALTPDSMDRGGGGGEGTEASLLSLVWVLYCKEMRSKREGMHMVNVHISY